MNTDGPANPQYELTAWIVLATDGLVASARERIKSEIEAHYADSVANHLTDGMTQAEAEALALGELGDINVAAKGFRKRYLTEQEEAWLREYEAKYRQMAVKRKGLLWYLGVCGLIGLVAYAALSGWWLRAHPHAFGLRLFYGCWIAVGIVFFLFMAVLLKTCRLATRHPPGAELRRKLLVLGLIQSQMSKLGYVASPIFFCLQPFFFHPLFVCIAIVLFVALITPFDRQFGLLRKLR